MPLYDGSGPVLLRVGEGLEGNWETLVARLMILFPMDSAAAKKHSKTVQALTCLDALKSCLSVKQENSRVARAPTVQC